MRNSGVLMLVILGKAAVILVARRRRTFRQDRVWRLGGTHVCGLLYQEARSLVPAGRQATRRCRAMGG
jgi:hypothetical protein